MRTHVITGGTDGIGKAVAHHYLDSGHEVVVVGRSAEKGKAWLDAARQRGAAGRAHFIHADLSLTTETRAAIDRVRSSFSTVDTLVLCARHFRTTRLVTAEGFENTFARIYSKPPPPRSSSTSRAPAAGPTSTGKTCNSPGSTTGNGRSCKAVGSMTCSASTSRTVDRTPECAMCC
jgi:NAD(P)-dependent dehydrogenase (short-subunit alcohol dehydrogenase family)